MPAIDAEHIEEVLRTAAQHDADTPLNPATGAVFTAQLTSASRSEHLLILRVHHMVSDGWSIDVLESELEELYDAARRRHAVALAPAPSYRNVVEQTDRTFFVDLDWREAEPYRSALRYWATQVEGVEPSALPTQTAPSMPPPQHSLALPSDELDVLPRASTGVREALAHGQLPLLAMCEEIPDLMSFMTESQFVGVELLSPARGLHLADCEIQRTDPFDDDFLGRRFELPVELLLVVRRSGSLVRLTVLYDPAVVSEDQSHGLLTRLRRMLLTSQAMEVCQ